MRHYYGVLGIDAGVGPDELKRVYRQLAARWHPDANAGEASAEARFKAIAEAHAVLSDPERRAAFDAALAEVAAGHVPDPAWVDRVFGVRERAPEPGRNRRYRVSVPLADVIRGTERVVELPRPEPCVACAGLAWAADGPPVVCGACGGRTEVVTRPVVRAAWGACPRCAGRGWVPAVSCATCKGTGLGVGVERLVVPIPAGTRDGESLRVKGRGEPGEPSGDLMVEVRHEADPRFVMRGLDVWHARPVPFWRALCGGPVTVATAWGPVVVEVPARTRDGDELRLPGWGVARRGEQRVTLEVEWPVGLGDGERAALARWAEALPEDAFPRAARAEREAASEEERR